MDLSASTQPGKQKFNKENKRVREEEDSSHRWSLGGKRVDSPLLEDLGLSVLQGGEEEYQPPTPTPPCTVPQQPHPKVLQDISQNLSPSPGPSVSPEAQAITQDDVFFVHKRRRLDPPEGDDKFNRMSDELILTVFRYLPKFMLARSAQVCRRWKRLAFDETLWRRLDLGGKTLKPGVVGRVVLRGCQVLRLAKAEVDCPIFSPQLQHVPNLPPVRSRLQCLDLSMAAITPVALEELLSVCCQLRKVSLEHCMMSAGVCERLAANPQLDTLNLSMCYRYNLNYGLLAPIMSSCKRLQSLNLAWMGLSREDLRVLCRRLPPSLERLNLSGCRNTLTDNNIRTLGDQCPGLVELDLSDATQLTDSVITILLRHLPSLEYLALSRCYNIQPDAYLELKALPHLQYLDVYGILNEKALASLQSSLPHIQVNKYLFSSVARPTVGIRRTSVWGFRVRDCHP